MGQSGARDGGREVGGTLTEDAVADEDRRRARERAVQQDRLALVVPELSVRKKANVQPHARALPTAETVTYLLGSRYLIDRGSSACRSMSSETTSMSCTGAADEAREHHENTQLH